MTKLENSFKQLALQPEKLQDNNLLLKQTKQQYMKKGLLALLLLICSFFSANAQPGLMDDFTSYTSGDVNNQGGWTRGSGSGVNLTVATASPLSANLGYACAGGNGSSGGTYLSSPAYTGSGTNRYNASFGSGFAMATAGNACYYSMLINVSAATANDSYTFSINTGSNYVGRMFIRTNSTGFQLGVSKNSNTAVYATTPTMYNFNTTYLVVVRYLVVSGTSNDQVHLWVNPSLTSEPSTSSGVEVTTSGSSDPSTGTYSNFSWQCATGAPTLTFDGLRVSSGSSSAAAWQNLMANTNYYLASSGNANATASWGSATDGTGVTPPVFSDNYHIFNLRNNATPTIGASWTVSGTASKIIVGNGTNSCNFTIPSSFSYAGTVDVSNAGTLTIQNTSIPTFGVLSTGSTINYNATGSSQAVSGANYSNLTLNNTSNFTLGGAASVSGTLTFTNGRLDLGANNLTLTSATVSGANSTNYFVTSGNGRLLRSIASGGGSFVFPIGRNSSTYNPVTITNTGGATSVYTVGVAATTYSPSADGIGSQWSIASGTSTTSTFAFSWTTSLAGANLQASPASGNVYSYNGSTWGTTGGTTSTGTPNVTTQSGITSANTIWTVAMPAAVPDIALADNVGGQVAAGTITKNTTTNIIYNFQLSVTTANATLNSVAFATTNNAADVTNYKLYYASTNSFGSASQIGSTISTSTGTGTHTFSSLTQSISSGATGYFWIVSDVPTGATPGNTIVVTALTTSDITVASGNKTGSASTGGTQTIIAAPTVTTNAAGTITTTSVVLNGTVNANASNTTASFDYGTTISYGTNVTYASNPVTGTSNTSVSYSLGSLGTNTLYHYRAKGTNSAGTTNGSDVTFTTLSNAPTVGSGSSILSDGFTANWTAPTNDGSETYTYTVEVDDDNAFGSINATYSSIASGTTSQAVTGLASGTTYYFRVKAVNTTGSSAWSSISSGVTTSSASAPAVTTTAASSITLTTASTGGNVTSDGGDAVTARGVVYNTTGSPTLADSYTTDGTGTGSFSSSLTGLSNNTTYYVKAYATNGVGTSYGSEISFTTLVAEPTTASTVTFGTKTTTSLVVNFSSGDGARRVVFVKQGSAVSYTPTDGTSPSGVNSVFGSGTQFGTGNWAVYDGTGSTVTVTGLTANTTYHIAVYEYNDNSAGVPNYYTTAGTANTTTYNPTITTTGTLSAFANTVTGNNSSSQSYTVSAVELSSSVTITAPTGFAISLDDIDYSVNPIVLTKDGSDAVPTTTIYVRFSPGSANGANSGNVTNAATSATTKNVAVSGNAIAAEPTTTGSISFGSTTANSIVVDLPTVGDGSNRIIVVKAGSAPTAPSDATSYTANAAIGSAGTTAAGSYVVYNGTGSGSSLLTVTGLTSGTTYYFAVYEYNVGTGASHNYLTSSFANDTKATNSASNATDSFRTAATGNWNSTSTWESKTNGSWMAATLTPDSSAAGIAILNGHTVTVSAAANGKLVTVNTTGQIIISSGQTLTIGADGTGTSDFNINGYVQNIGTLTFTTNVTGTVNSGGVYEHNRTISSGNLTFPVFTYNTGGKVKVTGTYTFTAGSGPSFPAGTYADVEIDCSVVTADSYIQFSNASTNINGELRITATGSGAVLMAGSSNTNQSCATFVLTAGNVFINRQASGARSLTVTGNATINGGELRIKTGTSSANNAILNVGGDLTLGASGTISNVTTSGSTYINFNGSTAQTFTRTGTLSSGVGIGINNASGVTVSSSTTFGDTYGPIFLTAGSITCSGTLTVGAAATITRVAGTFAATPTFAGAVSVTYANTSPITSSNELPSSNVTALSTAGGTSTVTIGSSTSISTLTVSGSNMTIGSGATVTASSTGSISASKTLQIDGTYIAGAALTNSGTMTVGSVGTYRHAFAAGTIPTATWSSGSTCEVTGSTGSAPSGLGQSFHHFIWSCSGQTTTFNLGGALTTINGNFTISNTGASPNKLRLVNGASTLTVGGNLTISAANTVNSILDLNNATGSSVINLSGDLTVSVSGSGNAQIQRGGGTGTIAFVKTSGVQTISSNYATAFTVSTLVWNVGNGSTTNTLQMNSDIALNATSTMVVLSGSALSCGTYVLGGATSLTVNNGGTLKVGSLSGSGAVAANVTVTTLTLSTGSTLEYNGAGAQFATARTVTNLTVNNGSTLTLSGNVTATGTLALTSGKVVTGSNTMIVGAAGAAGTITGASSSNYVNGNLQMFINNATNPTATFAIGDASNYTPVTVAINGTTTGSGSLTVNTTSGAHSLIASSGINSSKMVNRYYTITRNGLAGYTSYSPTFTFVSGDVLGGANTAAFVVRNYSGGTWSTTTTGTLTSTSSQATGLTTFTDFAIGEANTLTVATDPSNTTVCHNATNTTFTSSSSSVPSTTIQWYRDAGSGFVALNGTTDGGIYSGFTSGTLTLSSATNALNGYIYRATFTNINGSVNSASATLTVNATSVGGTVASAQTVCTGSTLSDLTLSGNTGNVTKWQSSSDAGFTSPTDITNTTTTLTAAEMSNTATKYYRAVVANGVCASANSSTVLITVNPNGTWLGASSSSFTDAANWCGGVPSSGADIVVPSGAPNNVTLSGNFTAGNVTVNDTIFLNNNKLTVTGTISGTPVLSGSNTSSFTYSGSSSATVGLDQTVDGSILHPTSGTNSIKDLTVDGGGTLTISGKANVYDGLLVSSGTLNTGGNLVLRATATTTSYVGPVRGTINGQVTVEKYYHKQFRGWRMCTAPVTYNGIISNDNDKLYKNWQSDFGYGGNYGTIVTGPVTPSTANGIDYNSNGANVLTYNTSGAGSWNRVLNTKTETMSGSTSSAANKGFFIFIRGDRTVSPNGANPNTFVTTTLAAKGLLQTGTQVFNFTGTSGNSWLVGNPYAAPVDLSSDSVIYSGITNGFYVWDPNLTGATTNSPGAYTAFDRTDWNSGPVSGGTDKYLQSGQSFFVKTNSASASITFKEGAKVTSANNNVNTDGTINASTDLFNVKLFAVQSGSTSTNVDGVRAKFGNYSGTVDADDITKVAGSIETISLSRANATLAIEARPYITVTDTLYIKMANMVAGSNYEFFVNPVNFDASVSGCKLIDNFLNTETPISLTSNTSIPFSVTSVSGSSAANRFSVVFTGAGALPTNKLTVSASKQNNQVVVNWIADAETGVGTYQVEKSNTGSNFTAINETAAKNGDTKNAYSFIDKTPGAVNYYRIRTINNNGTVKYSAIVKVEMNGKASGGISVYPNPVVGNNINLQLTNLAEGTAVVKLYNAVGQLVYTENISSIGSSSSMQLELSRNLAAGTYQLQITDAKGNVFKESVVKIK